MLIPWSAFWERNYFAQAWPILGGVMMNNYTRGAISGLGMVNVWAALAELADLFGKSPNTHQSPFDNPQ